MAIRGLGLVSARLTAACSFPADAQPPGHPPGPQCHLPHVPHHGGQVSAGRPAPVGEGAGSSGAAGIPRGAPHVSSGPAQADGNFLGWWGAAP